LKITDEAYEGVVRPKAVTSVKDSSSDLLRIEREFLARKTIALVL